MNRLTLLGQLDELQIPELLRSRKKWLLLADDAFHRHLGDAVGIDPGRVVRIAGIPTLGADAFAGYEVGVICTNGNEDIVRQAVQQKLGLRPLRLFADIVLRRAAGAEARTPTETPPQLEMEYAILCLPRCGSTLLTKELELLGLGHPKEHIRTPSVLLLQHRDISGFDFARWWGLVRANNSSNGVFGTKVIVDFLQMSTSAMDSVERSFLFDELKRMRTIRIVRRNKIEQAVSDFVARKTGVWHLWSSDIKQNYGSKLGNVDLSENDWNDLIGIYRKFVKNEEVLERMLVDSGVPLIDIDYDALTERPKQTVAEVVRQLGRSVPDDYLTGPVSLEPTRTATHERLYGMLAERMGVPA
jgi:LPS sulfotransferase NodH